MSFGCECSCSSHRRVSNFNSKVVQGVSTLIYNLKEIGRIFNLGSHHLGGHGGGGRGHNITEHFVR